MVWRKLCLTLHQWLGLGSSLFVVVLCLTGTLLALYGPIEAWVNRDVLRVTPKGQPIALEVLVPRLAEQAEKPFTGMVIPADPHEALQLRQGRDVTYVDPYSGQVLGRPDSTMRQVYLTTMRLHRWLLLDAGIGRPITGAVTVLFVVTLVLGVCLWVPKRLAQLGRSLWFGKGKGRRAVNYDLHVVLGFYAMIPLLVMGLSAFNWSYRAPFQATVHQVLDGKVPVAPPRRPELDAGAVVTDLPYAEILAAVNRTYPHAGPVRLTFPHDLSEPVKVSKVHAPSPVSMPYVDQLTVDARTGAVLKQEPFAERTRGEQVLSLIKDIHVGTLFGGASLTIYILACLVGTSLPITGVLHWWGKIRARRRAAERPIAVAEEKVPVQGAV